MAVVNIYSYFSLETDLAGEMRGWPEFVSGEEYSVDLRDDSTLESVEVRFVPAKEGQPYVRVRSDRPGHLFGRVVGRTIYAMAAHSDNVIVDRHELNEG